MAPPFHIEMRGNQTCENTTAGIVSEISRGLGQGTGAHAEWS